MESRLSAIADDKKNNKKKTVKLKTKVSVLLQTVLVCEQCTREEAATFMNQPNSSNLTPVPFLML